MGRKKKLTDKEIIEIFKNCTDGVGTCEGCPYAKEKGDDIQCNMRKMRTEIVEMVERLRRDNILLAEFARKMMDVNMGLDCFFCRGQKRRMKEIAEMVEKKRK